MNLEGSILNLLVMSIIGVAGYLIGYFTSRKYIDKKGRCDRNEKQK